MAKTMKKPTKAQQEQQDKRLQILNDMIIAQNNRKGRTEQQIHLDTILVLFWQSWLHDNQANTHALQHLYDRMFELKHDTRINDLQNAVMDLDKRLQAMEKQWEAAGAALMQKINKHERNK